MYLRVLYRAKDLLWIISNHIIGPIHLNRIFKYLKNFLPNFTPCITKAPNNTETTWKQYFYDD